MGIFDSFKKKETKQSLPTTYNGLPYTPPEQDPFIKNIAAQTQQNYGLGPIQKQKPIFGIPQVGTPVAPTQTAESTQQTTYQKPINVGKEIFTGLKVAGDVVKRSPQILAENVGQPSLQAYGAVGNSLYKGAVRTQNKLASIFGFEQQPVNDFTPTGQFQKDLYGTDKPLTFAQAGASNFGVSTENKFAPALGVFAGLSDAIPGGKGAKVLAKGADIATGVKGTAQVARQFIKEAPPVGLIDDLKKFTRFHDFGEIPEQGLSAKNYAGNVRDAIAKNTKLIDPYSMTDRQIADFADAVAKEADKVPPLRDNVGKFSKAEFKEGDKVRMIDKQTGRSQERTVTKVGDGYFSVADDVSNIPYRATKDKFDFELIKKGEVTTPQYKVGDELVDPTDGQKMKVEKVLAGNKYVVRDKEGLPITVTEKTLNNAKRTPTEAFGAVAGVEEDEQGNLQIDPLKAALGVTGAAALKRMKFRKGTSEAFQRADAEVTTQMSELSQAGKRIRLPDGTMQAYSSTFPDWVPSHLRLNDLFKSVLPHYEAGTIPKGVRQQELLDLMQKEVSQRAIKYGDKPMPPVRQMTRSKEIPSLEKSAEQHFAKEVQRIPTEQIAKKGTPEALQQFVNTQLKSVSSNIPTTESGKKLSTVRKLITGGERILRESGPSGRKMAQIMDKQRVAQDLLTGRYNVRINKALAGLSKEERLGVTQVLEGAEPMNDKVAKAAKEMRTWLDEVATRAETDQFTMKTSNGGTVPFKKRENYFPRQYNMDDLAKGKRRDQALEHLVETGQAQNLADAEKKLQMMLDNAQRRAGNLENPRMLDLPGYETDPKLALTRYAQSVAKRFTEAEYFGKKDEKIGDLIKGITNEKGDYLEAQRIFDYYVDGAPKNKLVSAITQFNVATKLSLSAILNATQSVNTATKFGVVNTAKGMWRGFTKEGKELAELVNVYDDFILVKETGVDPNKLVKGVMYVFKKVEDFNRRTAANVGFLGTRDLLKTLKNDPQSGYAIRQLESLGVDIEKALKGQLTDDDLLGAANKAIQKTQFKVDVLDLPPSWKTPTGRLLTQFKSFTFMQTKFVRDEIIKEARKGNLVPLVTFVSLAVPASYVVSAVRNKLTGRNEDDETKVDIREWDKWMKAFGTIPTDLLIQAKFLKDTYDSDYITPLEKGSRVAGTFLGPTAGEAGKLISGAEQVPRTQEKNKYLRKSGKEQDPYLSLKRQAVEKVPFVGQYTKNKYFGYPKSTNSPEKKQANQDVYGFADEMNKLPFGSEEAKTQTKAYIEGIKDEAERKRQAYILSQNGVDTKGISLSDDMIAGRPLYDSVQKLINEGKMDEAQRTVSTWTKQQKEQYTRVKTAETTKRTDQFKELLEADPKKAVEYARSLRKDQQEKLKDFLTRKGNEEWLEKYQQAK